MELGTRGFYQTHYNYTKKADKRQAEEKEE